jgi:hypothetical protein
VLSASDLCHLLEHHHQFRSIASLLRRILIFVCQTHLSSSHQSMTLDLSPLLINIMTSVRFETESMRQGESERVLRMEYIFSLLLGWILFLCTRLDGMKYPNKRNFLYEQAASLTFGSVVWNRRRDEAALSRYDSSSSFTLTSCPLDYLFAASILRIIFSP